MSHSHPFSRSGLSIALFLAMFLVASASDARAQEWTRFRGPNGSGVSDAKTIPVEWTAEEIRWKAKLPGSGISSPVIWGTKVFVTSAELDGDNGKRHLICLNAADGSELWRQSEPFQQYKKHKVNSYATSTPAVDEMHVYQVWQAAEDSSLLAFTHDGKPAWSYELTPFSEGHGGGVSPIIWNDFVILACDQKGPSFLLAVDRRTGEERWKTPRKSGRASYATPCIYQVAGRPDELIFTEWEHGMTGVDPLSGDVRWEIACFGKRTERAIASPFVAGDLVFGTCGFTTSTKHCVAVRPSEIDGKPEVQEIYRIEKTAPHIPTPLAYRDRLFMLTEKGIMTVANLATGEEILTRRVGGNYSASPICVNGNIYAVSDDGEVVVIKADDSLEELARNPLDEASRATPAVSGERLYVRSMSELLCIGRP